MNARTAEAASGMATGLVRIDQPHARVEGVPFQADWFDAVEINLSAVERRTATLGARRSVKKEWQAAWLVKAIQCIDLTTLAGDDTPGRVQRLCAKARHPLRDDLVEALGLSGRRLTTGAVCVYPTMVRTAVKALEGSGVPVASVATGFPAGLTPLEQRLAEIRYAVGEGAREIDIVITRAHALTGDWQALYDEISLMREACGEAHMKAILATGELKTLTNVYRASMVAMMSLVMVRAIRDFLDRTGQRVGFKPAGGIRAAKDALAWLILMKEELGRDWLEPDMFRFGASALLSDIERQLEHFVTGRYSAADRHGMA